MHGSSLTNVAKWIPHGRLQLQYACIHVMHPYITKFIYSVFQFLSASVCAEKMVSDSQSVAESCHDHRLVAKFQQFCI